MNNDNNNNNVALQLYAFIRTDLNTNFILQENWYSGTDFQR